MGWYEDDQVCMRQVFRPKEHHHLDYCGDCTKCKRHPDNEHCGMFFPIGRPSSTVIKHFDKLGDPVPTWDDLKDNCPYCGNQFNSSYHRHITCGL